MVTTELANRISVRIAEAVVGARRRKERTPASLVEFTEAEWRTASQHLERYLRGHALHDLTEQSVCAMFERIAQ